MADDPWNYSKPNAVRALKEIAKTTGNKRIAFAVGRFGPAVPVIIILHGRPSKARLKLDTAHYSDNAKPSGVNLRALPKKPIHVNHGELVWDPETRVLTLECAVKPSPVLQGMFWNYYQKQWGLAPFWQKEFNFGDLRDDAESRPETQEEGDAPGSHDPAEAEPIAPDAVNPDEPSDAATDAATAGSQERTNVADPVLRVRAQKLTESLLAVQNNLGMAGSADSAELEAMFERVLNNTDKKRRRDDGAEPEPQQPADQDGIDVVADVLVAMGTRLARQRGLLGSGELPDNSRIRAMVGKDWNLHQSNEPDVVLERLIKVVGLSFAKDGDALRGFLGLRPADALIPFLLSRWQDAHASIVARIAEIKTAVDVVLKREDPTDSVEKRGGSWDKVDQVPRYLDPARLAESLRALKGAKGEERLQKAAGLKAAIDDHRKYIEDNAVIPELDSNPFEVDLQVRDTFSKVLNEILESVPIKS